jgi:hypothetical protein
MTRRRPTPEQAFRLFADAVAALGDDPGPENLERYLAASRLLEETKRAPRPTPPARTSIAVKGVDAA